MFNDSTQSVAIHQLEAGFSGMSSEQQVHALNALRVIRSTGSDRPALRAVIDRVLKGLSEGISEKSRKT